MTKSETTITLALGGWFSQEISQLTTDVTRENPQAVPDGQSLRSLDRMRTFKEAAELIGLPYSTVQRAAKAGILPTYSMLNQRKYVTLRDIYHLMSRKTQP